MNSASQLSRRYPRFIALVISLLLIITPPPPVLAATIKVDEGCDFRQAVRSARDNAAPSGSDCEAGDASGHGAADIIRLTRDISVSASENLTRFSGSTPVDYAIIIEGNGYRISGPNALLYGGLRANLTLNNIIISGKTGASGAVFERLRTLNLTIRNSVFEDNSSSGAFEVSAGVLSMTPGILLATIEDSVFRNNSGHAGGAIAETASALHIRRSVFENNRSASWGGALSNLGAIIDDSSFIGNSANGAGGAILAAGNLTVRNSTFSGNRAPHSIVTLRDQGSQFRATYQHVTFTGNTVTSTTGGIVSRWYDLESIGVRNHFLDLFNSVVAGNTGPDIACASVPGSPPTQSNLNVTSVATSYIEDGSCGAEMNLENNGPALLGERQTTRKGQVYYVPQPRGTVTETETDDVTGEEIEVVVTITSPLIDAGAAAHCLSRDQLGRSRSAGSSCDIGAIEYAPPPVVASRGVYKPPTPVGSTCDGLQPGTVSVSPVYDGMQCQQVGDAGVGNQVVVEAGYTAAVDIWGWVGGQGTEVCFNQPGMVILLDAAASPRKRVDLASYARGSQTCARIYRTGTVILLPPQPLEMRELRACKATALTLLNLRSTPGFGDNVIGLIAEGAVMDTDRRAGDWYRVTVEGLTGWISADYTRTAGVCMPAGG